MPNAGLRWTGDVVLIDRRGVRRVLFGGLELPAAMSVVDAVTGRRQPAVIGWLLACRVRIAVHVGRPDGNIGVESWATEPGETASPPSCSFVWMEHHDQVGEECQRNRLRLASGAVAVIGVIS